MSKVTCVAKTAFPYDGVPYEPGAKIEVDRSHVLILKVAGRIEDAAVDATPGEENKTAAQSAEKPQAPKKPLKVENKAMTPHNSNKDQRVERKGDGDAGDSEARV